MLTTRWKLITTAESDFGRWILTCECCGESCDEQVAFGKRETGNLKVVLKAKVGKAVWKKRL